MSPDPSIVGRDPDVPTEEVVQVATASHLIVHLGDQLYGLPTEAITQVIEAQRPVRVPTAPSLFLGVVHIRGQILAVVGLRELLGITGESTSDPAGRRLVALEVDGLPFAFVADGVLGIRDIALTGIRDTEDDEGDSPIRGEFDQAEGVVTVLEPTAIVRGLS